MKREHTQTISIFATIAGVISLAIWTLPVRWNYADLAAHLSFEVIRASILIGNIQVTKQSHGFIKPSLVFIGSIVLTGLIGIQIASEFHVCTTEEYFLIPEFWAKQMGNVAVLIAEVTLSFQLGSDATSYKILEQEKSKLEHKFNDLSKHFHVDHSSVPSWDDVAYMIIEASKSERKDLEKLSKDLETFRNGLGWLCESLEAFREDLGMPQNSFEDFKNGFNTSKTILEKFRIASMMCKTILEKFRIESDQCKTILEKNRIILETSKTSINGTVPIVCNSCGTINDTHSNNTASLNCLNCGHISLKKFKNP